MTSAQILDLLVLVWSNRIEGKNQILGFALMSPTGDRNTAVTVCINSMGRDSVISLRQIRAIMIRRNFTYPNMFQWLWPA